MQFYAAGTRFGPHCAWSCGSQFNAATAGFAIEAGGDFVGANGAAACMHLCAAVDVVQDDIARPGMRTNAGADATDVQRSRSGFSVQFAASSFYSHVARTGVRTYFGLSWNNEFVTDGNISSEL